jgi:hypothetical protein
LLPKSFKCYDSGVYADLGNKLTLGQYIYMCVCVCVCVKSSVVNNHIIIILDRMIGSSGLAHSMTLNCK